MTGVPAPPPAPPPTPPPAPPPAVRRSGAGRWRIGLAVVAVLAPVVLLAVVLGPLLLKEKPRAVRPDVCALVPADLLARVVPAGKVAGVAADNAGASINAARCRVETDDTKATSSARATLSIEVRRHGSLGRWDPGDHARDEFAGGKGYELADTNAPRKVHDLSRLGDSAFVAVYRGGDSDAREHRSVVHLQVLARDMLLRIDYDASPTREDLATAAAVAVARALLGSLR
jgi:hypothetical protein